MAPSVPVCILPGKAMRAPKSLANPQAFLDRSGTGTASWAGWLTDAGTNNNATQLHVINQQLGGNGGATQGNIGPGSQNLNSHHLHQAEKYVKNELFGSSGAKYDFTYTCTFDYSNSVDKVHNTPTAKDTAIGDRSLQVLPLFLLNILATRWRAWRRVSNTRRKRKILPVNFPRRGKMKLVRWGAH